MSNSLDPDQARRFVGPDLGPNCLPRLSADDTGRQRVKCRFCLLSFHVLSYTDQYTLFHAGGWGSIALVGHSSRSLLNLYTKLAGEGKLSVLADSHPSLQNLKKGGSKLKPVCLDMPSPNMQRLFRQIWWRQS